MTEIQELNGFKRGQRVLAREAYKKDWRPAYIAQLTFQSESISGGAYISWLDVTPGDFSKSAGGWHPLHTLRHELHTFLFEI